MAHVLSMFRELIDARTSVEILSAIIDLIQDQEDVSGDQLVQVHAQESTRLQQMIIRPGDEEGIPNLLQYLWFEY